MVEIAFHNYFIYKFLGRAKYDINKTIRDLKRQFGYGFAYTKELGEDGESEECVFTKIKKQIYEFSIDTPDMRFLVDYSHGLDSLMKTEIEHAKMFNFKIVELNKHMLQNE